MQCLLVVSVRGIVVGVQYSGGCHLETLCAMLKLLTRSVERTRIVLCLLVVSARDIVVGV